MTALLAIIHYALAGTVDLADKFLISGRQIRPGGYTFWTVATGLLVLPLWPLVFRQLSKEAVALSLLSGVLFSIALYLFFRVLSAGLAAQIVPFVFGVIPVFDLAIALLSGRGLPQTREIIALCLLGPGALLVSYSPAKGKHLHLGAAVLAAACFSIYFFSWQGASALALSGEGAVSGGGALLVANALMWNRIGAAAAALVCLAWPAFRRQAFSHDRIKRKGQTAALFVAKQLAGGANFIFYSWLLAWGNIAVLNSLQGFRYVTVMAGGWALAWAYKSWPEPRLGREEWRLKLVGLLLIFAGTAALFWRIK